MPCYFLEGWGLGDVRTQTIFQVSESELNAYVIEGKFSGNSFDSIVFAWTLLLALSIGQRTMGQLLCFKNKCPNHFAFTLGCYLFLLFLVQFI
jgi:hypothetical protein